MENLRLPKTMLDFALYYAEKLNWSIIPINPNNKKPFSGFEWKRFQKEHATRDEIIEWFTNTKKYPDAGIAVVTGKVSGITAIDGDPRHGATFEMFNRTVTLTTNSGGGGKHYIFTYIPDINSVDLKNGFEIKNDRRCLTLPPSLHPSGNQYSLSMGPFSNTPLASFPEFLKLWYKKTMPKQNFDISILNGVADGSRNNDGCSLVGKLVSYIPEKDWLTVAWPVLNMWNARCTPPVSQNRLKNLFDGICSNEREKLSVSQTIYISDKPTDYTLKEYSYSEFINIEFPPHSWLIDHLIPIGGITCISGRPKVGKSLFSLFLAVCLARGKKLFNQFQTLQSNVLYISKDEPASLTQSRLKKMTSETTDNFPITFLTEGLLSIEINEHMQQLKKIIDKNKCSVVVIDSFRRIFKGDENSSQVINDVQKQLRQLLDLGITVIFIHHHGKEGFFKRSGGDKLRGSSDILAMLDSLIFVESAGEEKLKITQDVLRSDKPINPFVLQLNTLDPNKIELNFDVYIEPSEQKQEIACHDILNLLSEDNKQYNQSDLIKILSTKGIYGKTTIKTALKELEESRRVGVSIKGNQKIYSQFIASSR